AAGKPALLDRDRDRAQRRIGHRSARGSTGGRRCLRVAGGDRASSTRRAAGPAASTAAASPVGGERTNPGGARGWPHDRERSSGAVRALSSERAAVPHILVR